MEKAIIELKILDYSEYTGPRYVIQGDHSGEDYYHTKLNQSFYSALKAGKKLVVDLDNTAGYLSSFLDEAFGNLVYDFTHEIVIKNIDIVSNQEPDWREMIFKKVFPDWEKRRIQKDKVRITANHQEWIRLRDGEYKSAIWIQQE